MLVNDMAAAKFFLEEKLNNSEECNVDEMILVGAEDGASIGALWLAAEWARKKPIYKFDMFTMREVYVGDGPDSGGRDIAAAVWLSLRTNLGGTKSQQPVLGWLNRAQRGRQSAGLSEGPHVLLPRRRGQGRQQAGQGAARHRHQQGQEAAKTPSAVELPKTNLAGSELLKGDVGTDDFIARYVTDKVMKDRPMSIWTKRDTGSCPLHLVPQQTLTQAGGPPAMSESSLPCSPASSARPTTPSGRTIQEKVIVEGRTFAC